MLDPVQQAQLDQLNRRVEDAASLAQEQDDLLEGVDVSEGVNTGGDGAPHLSEGRLCTAFLDLLHKPPI